MTDTRQCAIYLLTLMTFSTQTPDHKDLFIAMTVGFGGILLYLLGRSERRFHQEKP